jgi:hypothetical protein
VQRHGRRVRFFSTVELVNVLEQEKAGGRQGQMAHRLMYVDLVILDELGYLPFSQSGGALLFHLLSKLYERTSVIVTTNLSLHGVGQRLQRCQDDHGAARPPDASLPYRGNRQRVLALQNEFGQAAAWPNSFPQTARR